MATKQLTVVRPGRYGTRMLQAGEAFEATAPEARLYVKLGWAKEKAERAPRSAYVPEAKATVEPQAAPAKRRRRKKA